MTLKSTFLTSWIKSYFCSITVYTQNLNEWIKKLNAVIFGMKILCPLRLKEYFHCMHQYFCNPGKELSLAITLSEIGCSDLLFSTAFTTVYITVRNMTLRTTPEQCHHSNDTENANYIKDKVRPRPWKFRGIARPPECKEKSSCTVKQNTNDCFSCTNSLFLSHNIHWR